MGLESLQDGKCEHRDRRTEGSQCEDTGKKRLCVQAMDCWKTPEREEIKKDPPQELSEGLWPCQQLDFGFLAFGL